MVDCVPAEPVLGRSYAHSIGSVVHHHIQNLPGPCWYTFYSAKIFLIKAKRITILLALILNIKNSVRCDKASMSIMMIVFQMGKSVT